RSETRQEVSGLAIRSWPDAKRAAWNIALLNPYYLRCSCRLDALPHRLGIAGTSTDDYLGPALLVLFVIALILAFLRYFAERPALVSATPNNEFPDPPLARFFWRRVARLRCGSSSA